MMLLFEGQPPLGRRRLFAAQRGPMKEPQYEIGRLGLCGLDFARSFMRDCDAQRSYKPRRKSKTNVDLSHISVSLRRARLILLLL